MRESNPHLTGECGDIGCIRRPEEDEPMEGRDLSRFFIALAFGPVALALAVYILTGGQ